MMAKTLKNVALKKFDLLLFNQELVSLLDAGLTIVEALETLIGKEINLDTRALLNKILLSLKEGNSLSYAFSSQSRYYPELYIASVKSSEKTGGLSDSIKKYINYQLQIELIKKKIVSAAIYPMLLLCVGGMVIVFLLGYVVPKFSHIFTESGRDLPLASRVLIQLGNAINDHGVLIFSIIIILITIAIYFLKLPSTQSKIVGSIWGMPIIGDRLKTYQLSRFYRSLSMLLGAGIPVVQALEQSSSLLGRNLVEPVKDAVRLVKEGNTLSSALTKNGLTTQVALSLIKVGEKTGQMAKMLEKVADFHDEEINRWIELSTKLLEPVLMTIIGVVVGAIVVLMYLPIFELAGNIQ
jgi:general secretion pathway protein F